MQKFEVGTFYDIKLKVDGIVRPYHSCEVLAVDAGFIRIKFPGGPERDLDITSPQFVSATEGRPACEPLAQIKPLEK